MHFSFSSLASCQAIPRPRPSCCIEYFKHPPSRYIKQKNKTLSGLRKEQTEHDKALEEARAKQAKARSEVLATEKKLKKA